MLIHGFTQSSGAWDEFVPALAAEHEIVAFDAPGHGKSAGVEADLPAGADLMAAAAPGPASWVGYSMGGRFALNVAIRHPESVRRLVLVSASAGIEDPAERAARRRSDEALAQKVEEVGVDQFVRDWLDQAMFATLPPHAAALESRLGGTAEGLASSLRLAGAGSQEPLWDRLSGLTMPVLAVAGELDRKYVGVATRVVEAIGPNATLHVLQGAGHACHLEQPDLFLDVVAPFLSAS